MFWRWSIESKFPCRGITGCWTRLLWQKTQSCLRKRCERRKHQLKCTTTKERGIHFATSFVHKVQTQGSIITLKLQLSRTVEWFSFSSIISHDANHQQTMRALMRKLPDH